VEQSHSRTTGGTKKISASLSAKFFGSGAEVTGEGTKSGEETLQTAPLELDPTDPNDIIMALKKIAFSKFIVLEDFHYLSDRIQSEFSIALKTYHEESDLIFIIVGVWIDENRLVQHNGDLAARITTINADQWKTPDLLKVITKGEELLNIRFSNMFKRDVVDESADSVWVVQEICRRACEDSGVIGWAPTLTDVHPSIRAREYARAVADDQTARYMGFLDAFPAGFKTTELELYKWILLPVIAVDPTRLEKGVETSLLRNLINKYHPKRPVPEATLWQSLQSVTSLQVEKRISPVILDHDGTTRRLFVVDRGFLVWLRYQQPLELLKSLGLPEIRVDDNNGISYYGT
jgi:hypothetical protein